MAKQKHFFQNQPNDLNMKSSQSNKKQLNSSAKIAKAEAVALAKNVNGSKVELITKAKQGNPDVPKLAANAKKNQLAARISQQPAKSYQIINNLTHPLVLFSGLFLVVVLLSICFADQEIPKLALQNSAEQTVVTPLKVRSLLQADAIFHIASNLVNNFIKFPPVGVVIVMMLGLGLVEQTGLAQATIKRLLGNLPKHLLIPCVLLAGILGNLLGSSAFLLIPPLGAYLFKSRQQSPLVGLLTAFIGVAAGHNANLFITPTDLILAGITQGSWQLSYANAVVTPTSNYFFMAISVPYLTIVGSLAIKYMLQPRLLRQQQLFKQTTCNIINPNINSSFKNVDQKSEHSLADGEDLPSKFTPKHWRIFLLVSVAYCLIIAGIFYYVSYANQRGLIVPNGAASLSQLLAASILPCLCLYLFIIGFIAGRLTKQINNVFDLANLLAKSLNSICPFLVLCFCAAQFLAAFDYSHLGLLLTAHLVNLIQSLPYQKLLLLCCLILLVTLINFVIGSSSAKWALLAPIIVPLFWRLGVAPPITQAAYRIADSVTNCISPLEPFMALVISLACRYEPKFNYRMLLHLIWPVALCLLVAWTGLFMLWYSFGFAFGI